MRSGSQSARPKLLGTKEWQLMTGHTQLLASSLLHNCWCEWVDTYLIKLFKFHYLCEDMAEDIFGCVAAWRQFGCYSKDLSTLTNIILQILVWAWGVWVCVCASLVSNLCVYVWLTFVSNLCNSHSLRREMFVEIKQIKSGWRKLLKRWWKHLHTHTQENRGETVQWSGITELPNHSGTQWPSV